jgi:hypothetical protein
MLSLENIGFFIIVDKYVHVTHIVILNIIMSKGAYFLLCDGAA